MGYIWVVAGGGIGALSRYLLAGWIDNRHGPGPLGIFVVNISGALIIGFFMTLAEERFLFSPDLRRFVATGFLGGYTTFSTLSWDTTNLLRDHSYALAVFNGIGSIVLGVVAVYVGIALARLV